MVSASDQPLLRMEMNDSLVPHADLSSLNIKTWNEIAIDSIGYIYVNEGDMIALVTPDGFIKKVAENLSFPNGMLVTTDDSTFVVAESHGKRLTAFDIMVKYCKRLILTKDVLPVHWGEQPKKPCS